MAHELMEYSLLPVPGRLLSLHPPYSKSSFLRFLIAAGMVSWSPAGMRGCRGSLHPPPPQDGGDGDDVDDGPWLGLIQLLRSALARLPPPGGGGSCGPKPLGLHAVCTLFMCGVHIVYTKSLLCTSCHAFSPARGIVVEAIDHGTVAVHQNRPVISILLVRLHPDTDRIRNRSTTRQYQQFSRVASNSARPPSKNGGGGMKKTKSIRTCWWWLRKGLQLTN
jgi:hypothetical protein